MSESRTINSVKNIMTGFMSQGIVYIVGFINRMVFVRCLSTEYLGVSALFSNVLSLLSLAELGIGSAIVFALYKPLAEKDNTKIRKLMHFYATAYKTIGCVVAVVGLCLMPFLKYLIGTAPDIKENIYILYLLSLLNVVISYFFSYKSSLLNADQKNYILTIVNSIITIVQCVIQTIVLVTTKNYIFYLLCQSLCLFAYNIIISKIADIKYPILKLKLKDRLDEADRKSLFINVKALVITKLSGVLVNSTDNIIITAIIGLSVTGLNSNYVLLTTSLNGILTTIFNGITASIGNANVVMNKSDRTQLFYTVNFMNFWLYGWSSIAFLFLSNDIVKLFFGSQYVLSYDIVIIMAINYFTVGMQNGVLTFYSSLGLFNFGKFVNIFTGIINIVLSIILGRLLGLFGILFATFLSRLFTNLWYMPYALFKHGLYEKFRLYCFRYFIFLLQITISIILIYFLFKINFGSYMISFIYKLVICILLPNIVFYILNKNSIDFIELKTKIFWLLKRKQTKY